MDYLVVFLPLLAALIAGLFRREVGETGSQFITCGAMTLASIFSLILFKDVVIDGNERILSLFTWMASGDFNVNWSLKYDTLSVVMICVVNIVSTCVHYYSVGYMSHDHSKQRFMAYLSLFTFMMLMLVTANNFLQLFFGWEGVGVASYLLIGFWHHKDSANSASMKAFIVNRVGDFGLALGVIIIFLMFGSVQFDVVFSDVQRFANMNFNFWGFEIHALTLACLFLFMGAMGKSAQLGLHTWLPDAMEGPTPVSALIHAATMVTAGVFLVARTSPLFEFAPDALMVVTVVGALTAIVAATIGLTQFDIKRVIAYSTMSQLGYMFFALGVSAYGAAIFHLMTHAFFKALLFLGAGSVIHAMSNEQDMRNMGGIWKKIPFTYAMMWIGSLALAGIPFFAGYYSKDIILESAFADHTWFGHMAYYLGVTAALLTAFYSWRLIFMTFHGKQRADEKVMDHVHESPAIMTVPLFVLAVGAVLSGYLGYDYFVGHSREDFWAGAIFVLPENDVLELAHHIPGWAILLPLVVAVSGIVLAFIFYILAPTLPFKTSQIFKPVHKLFFNKWYFDQLYKATVVKPAWALGEVFSLKGDKQTIDRFGPDGVAAVAKRVGSAYSKVQSGLLYHYAFIMIIGFVLIIGYVVYGDLLVDAWHNIVSFSRISISQQGGDI